ncbi:hypothetical protein [Singulisphaera acidiphila]|uniref:Uncharacterized protein n=1 Tax=Singulisphaera acidiphila (strain ATCC BAA-1392 / DSM 18658 / VKM B-2454 / MOB10) TaxID=886293 RepID=L0DIB2_SINAD|nr:hypothetical protein [Singulisphaera acidiphila]AGA28997.1 hypothetical protein Sinac_4838 [Singulisphaera acidiphila DSM 18658]
MALCDEGYLCEVCGRDVEDLTQSDLYLRYVLGEVDPETLHVRPERHLACNPSLAQFIVAADFPPVTVEGYFAKSALDPDFVAAEEARVTRGYLRLLELMTVDLPIVEYPLPEFRARWQGVAESEGEGTVTVGTEPPSRSGQVADEASQG